jgi:hypothetical protein
MHLLWYFCNISMYVSFVMDAPEDGCMSGRNMQQVSGVDNMVSYSYVHSFGLLL